MINLWNLEKAMGSACVDRGFRFTTARRAKRFRCTSPAGTGRIRGISDVCLNQIVLVMDAGTPAAAFSARRELQTYLRRRLDTFINPLVYTFCGNRGLSIMTMSSALAE
jgi:hypothetical protein